MRDPRENSRAARPRRDGTALLAATVFVALLYTPGCSPRARDLDMRTLSGLFPEARDLRIVPCPAGQDSSMRLSVIDTAAGLVGYVAEGKVVSRSGPFAIRVIMTGRCRVLRAEVVDYPAKRGRDVRSRRFTRQFAGRGPDDPIRIGKDIDAVTGATLSARAMAAGVRRAVRMARRHAAQTQAP